jgi:hypothetical protein
LQRLQETRQEQHGRDLVGEISKQCTATSLLKHVAFMHKMTGEARFTSVRESVQFTIESMWSGQLPRLGKAALHQ